jgi:hypothetical protein
MKNLILNTIETSKKSFNLAMQSNVKRIYTKMEKIIETFPEIYGKGYIVMTLGEFALRNKAPLWQIEDLKRNNQYNKKGCFKLSCVEIEKNNFTGESVLTDPQLVYMF